MHKVTYTDSARKDLKALEVEIARRIIKKVYFFSTQDNPLRFAEKLTDFRFGSYRFRIGDYRAIFDADHNGSLFVLTILRVRHRKDVYHE